MERFIHRENLALYRKRLEEPHTQTEREVLLKPLAQEEANENHPNKVESRSCDEIGARADRPKGRMLLMGSGASGIERVNRGEETTAHSEEHIQKSHLCDGSNAL